ncbi:TldD/PmbA family protein [Nakamurella leprariae]|uniref:TldD/PmbA family protein n=1 Tax=Nakamurella leprariae TaxID=2803911 RepID=UPI002E2DE1A5|nr:TldD/PmbA family protein [Nakamurella leprariae]
MTGSISCPDVDADFLALPLTALADAALAAATAAGAEHADFRFERIRGADIMVRDHALQRSSEAVTSGYAVRVIAGGSWGFAASDEPTADAAARTARQAVAVARAVAALGGERVERADEPVHAGARWCSDYRIDPFAVPVADRIGLLLDRSERLLAGDGVDHTAIGVELVKEQKFYADTAGSTIWQQRVRMQPEFTAITVDTAAGSFEDMTSLAPPVGRGWEYLTDGTWDFDGELARMPGQLAEKLKAPSIEPGRYDLVIDPTNLWLTIHESIGHATEYDRAIGYEAAYAGTSFATPDGLGTLKYGSPVMHVTGDRTVPHGLATVGYDDDGVAAQRWDLVSGGILTGYQLDRVFAHRLGLERSNGCAFADSPSNVPIQRMANVSLQPDPAGGTLDDLVADVEDGIYVVGDKSWSIDMQRYNFQFTGQRFHRIRNGRIEGQVRDVAYQATTTDFWGAMDAVGNPSTYLLGGAFNCGKGQPGQTAAVSHGCPVARFRGISVLNTVREAGA